tara:strand:- start:59 stop:337 length:279 start_codon:yes stop_codon:yes gene_type:complete
MSEPTGDDAPPTIREILAEENPEALFISDMDDALIGYGGQHSKPQVAIYSASRIVNILVSQGASRLDAVEHFDFNISCAWVGEHTPIIVMDF